MEDLLKELNDNIKAQNILLKQVIECQKQMLYPMINIPTQWQACTGPCHQSGELYVGDCFCGCHGVTTTTS